MWRSRNSGLMLLVTGNGAYTIFAQAEDRTGFARGTLAPRPGMAAPIPAMDPRPLRTMADMGMAVMDHGGSGGMAGMNHGSLPGMDHSAMGHGAMANMSMGGHGPGMTGKEGDPGGASMDGQVGGRQRCHDADGPSPGSRRWPRAQRQACHDLHDAPRARARGRPAAAFA